MSIARTIIEFCHVLRGLGVRVSTSEILDCGEALLQQNWMDKEQIRATFQATLIKRFEDISVFHEAFTTFFSASEIRKEPRKSREIQQQEMDEITPN